MPKQNLYYPPILSAKEPIPLRTFLTCVATNLAVKDVRESALRELFDPFCREIYNKIREYVNPIFENESDVIRIEANICTTNPDGIHFYIYKTCTIPNKIESIELNAPNFKGIDYDAMALGHYLIDAYGFQKDSSDTLARNICFIANSPLAPIE